MFYKCTNCGHIFEEGEEAHCGDGFSEPRIAVCPACGDFFELAKPCQCCGGQFLEDELTEGMCEECIEETINDYSFGHISELYLISSDEKEEVELNAFIASMFSPSQINELLLQELLKQNETHTVDCSYFIKSDKNWFIEKIAEHERG